MVELKNLQLLHPCFAAHGGSKKGRIHLPVSPGCNIECRYCERGINDFEQAPGVSNGVLTPIEAVEAVGRALAVCPEITVAGIAGPGDTLATPYALGTFRLIKSKYPQIIKCMSTNGLMLKEKVNEIVEVGIDTLTVTINAVTPLTASKIYKGVYYNGKHYIGNDAIQGAEILLNNQYEGLRLVCEAGVTVKVNTVYVPEVNGDEIPAIAEKVSKLGAKLYNIIPLIPRCDFKQLPAPTCEELAKARNDASEHIRIFSHCQRCRADAVGTLGGDDYRDIVFGKRLNATETFSHG